MLEDLDHPAARGEPVYDIAYENVQAGLRTDYLFRLANKEGGFVVGTGDLSELALGWCTYGVGDHMSHYNVNGGAPKTLIQHLIRWVADSNLFNADTSKTLLSVLSTEISPELIPGAAPQSTQAIVGPYELQDFNLSVLGAHGARRTTTRRSVSGSRFSSSASSPTNTNAPPCRTVPRSFPAAHFRHAATGACPAMQRQQRGSTNCTPTAPTS
jgi:NH3-dependent NAD+ synthetase